jgi:hypothetical protein
MDANLFNALVRAAAAKGGPLSDEERRAVVSAAAQARDREYWAKRLRAVVILAGYTRGYADSVVVEYLDRYLLPENMAGFAAMLKKYEEADGDPI